MKETREYLRSEYKDRFPEELLPTLATFVEELAKEIDYYFGCADFTDRRDIWFDNGPSLNKKEYFDECFEEDKEKSIAEILKVYGNDDEVQNYCMIRWLLENVQTDKDLCIRMLSILNLDKIWKPDSIKIVYDDLNECLVTDIDFDTYLQEGTPVAKDVPIYNISSGIGLNWPEELYDQNEK